MSIFNFKQYLKNIFQKIFGIRKTMEKRMGAGKEELRRLGELSSR